MSMHHARHIPNELNCHNQQFYARHLHCYDEPIGHSFVHQLWLSKEHHKRVSSSRVWQHCRVRYLFFTIYTT